MTIEMTVSEARARLSDVLDTARVRHEPVFLTRHGKRVGVIAGVDQWMALTSVSNEEVARRIEQIAEQGRALIKPGTPPLLDVSAFYETREPRL